MDSRPTYADIAKGTNIRKQGDTAPDKPEKTDNTSNEQLEKAHALELLGDFALAAATDLNHLLNGISLKLSSLLSATTPAAPLFNQLTDIKTHVISAENLAGQILSLANKNQNRFKSVEINQLVRDSLKNMSVRSKDVTVHAHYQKDLWSVEVDAQRIIKALLSMYENAFAAMPDGGALYIQTENATLDGANGQCPGVAPGAFVKISVTDNGIGMDKKTQAKIFEPFFTTQGDKSAKGLGLTEAYSIVHKHGGNINVYSEVDKGTTINVYFPVSGSQFIAIDEFVEEVSLESETILLVDDENVAIEVAGEMLEKLGYKTIIANNGQEAIDIYRTRQEQIDMVLLDMVMPDLDGGATYDFLKKLNPGIKVLLASGYGRDDRITAVLKRGCDGFVQKPFTLKQLSHKIKSILHPQ
jgi:two-component system, cell cycle sensor histidine kinase and response regulator CckA